MPSATVENGTPSYTSSTEVTLSGSFSGATAVPDEAGFWYGTSASSLTNKVVAKVNASSVGDTYSGTFTAALDDLVPGETYVFQSYAVVAGTGTYSSTSFWLITTPAACMDV